MYKYGANRNRTTAEYVFDKNHKIRRQLSYLKKIPMKKHSLDSNETVWSLSEVNEAIDKRDYQFVSVEWF